jgi:hypothetical protein
MVFEKWRAQKKAWELNEEETEAFLNEPVEVAKLERVAKAPGVCQARGSPLPPMTRIVFLRVFVVWYAIAVLGAAIFNPHPGDNPADVAVQQALDRMADMDITSYNNAYNKYVFDGDKQDLGYYARNTQPSGNFVVSGWITASETQLMLSPYIITICYHQAMHFVMSHYHYAIYYIISCSV